MMRRFIHPILTLRCLCLVLAMAVFPGSKAVPAQSADPSAALREQGYTLEKVVVLSRHNIRSPLSGKGSVLDSITPYDWIDWTSGTSELTVRGGVAENAMGQYFRLWATQNGLFEENARPAEGEIRFYANSKQRTLATAKSFSAGMFPVANIDVESHAEFDTMDPVFMPSLHFVSDSYNEAVQEEINEIFRSDTDLMSQLQKGFDLITDVIDYTDSPAYRDGECSDLIPDDFEVVLETGEEPAMKNSLKLATSISDALVLQSYESDEETAGFGRVLTDEEWRQISAVKDIYGDILFTSPLVSVNLAHPMLEEILTELNSEHKFTFLCGHDSNLGSVLSSLDVESYKLPNTPEVIPIGSKLTLQIWTREGESYIAPYLVYAGADQLRNLDILTPDNPPEWFRFSFHGIAANDDGLYTFADFTGRIQEALDAYDELIEEYADAEYEKAA